LAILAILAILASCGAEPCIFGLKTELDILYQGLDGTQVAGGEVEGRRSFECAQRDPAECWPDRLVIDVTSMGYLFIGEVPDFALELYLTTGSTVSSTVAITRTPRERETSCGSGDIIKGSFP
jgi:hypothetical protein